MKTTKMMALLLAGLLVWFGAAPALAEGEGGSEEESSNGGDAVGTNVNYFLSNPPPYAGATGAGEEGYDESFYFGEGEEQIWLSKKIERTRYQDRSGEASHTMKHVIGWTMFTMGTVMGVWGAAFHYESRSIASSADEYKKYEKLGYFPLVTEQKFYWPSVVAGAGLTGGAFWLMNKK
jgi:hypothetical protein